MILPPNAPDQLPGRLQRRQPTKNQNAGPVNCIRLFGFENLQCPLFLFPFSSSRFIRLFAFALDYRG